MKEQILKYLQNHPESRKCDIARALGVWRHDKTFLSALSVLKREGKIKVIYHPDIWNTGCYDTFSVIEI